jgi:hypothetical protein
MVIGMATAEGQSKSLKEALTERLTAIKNGLETYHSEQLRRGRVVFTDWLNAYRASLAVIDNMLKDLDSLSGNTKTDLEIVKRLKTRLGLLEEHLKTLTSHRSGATLLEWFVRQEIVSSNESSVEFIITALNDLVGRLETEITGAVPTQGQKRVPQIVPESEILDLFIKVSGELNSASTQLAEASKTISTQSQREDSFRQIVDTIKESYNILRTVINELTTAFNQFQQKNYHEASQAMGRVNTNLDKLQAKWTFLVNWGLSLGDISNLRNQATTLTAGINSYISGRRQQEAALRKYSLLRRFIEV